MDIVSVGAFSCVLDVPARGRRRTSPPHDDATLPRTLNVYFRGWWGRAVFHMSTGLWMLLPEPPPPFRQRSGCFTTARVAPGSSPQLSTRVSTLVDNSTVVIYERPCETTENQLDMRLRRDPGGHIDLLCTASSTACGWCGQTIPAPGGLRYGNHPRIHPQPSTGCAPHSSTNYTVDTQFSVDGSAAAATLPDDEFL